MNPGRDLDKLIAEKIFNLSFDPPEGWVDSYGEGWRNFSYKYYSTDIKAAWEEVNDYHVWEPEGE